MDELVALRDETDHDKLMERMKNIDVSGLFEAYNTRVLLASFMLSKFPVENSINDDLYELSKIITDAMIALDFMKLSKNYKKYFEKFLEWRNIDISHMRQDLRDQVEACRTTMTAPRDIADQTWNEYMENSIHLMNTTEQKLQKMSRTPPKS